MEVHAAEYSLLAPLVAIGFALTTKRVIPSLGAGVVVAALVAASIKPRSLVMNLAAYAEKSVWDLDHLTISAFSLTIAAMVGVVSQAGGTAALVGRVEQYAKGRRGAMVSSWLAGAIVFFDDYANCLVVGNSMGPLYDRHRVSRAKLSYIVDSTAAPVASLALVSTWVGYEVGLIDAALQDAGSSLNAFGVFVDAIPYRFYSLFTIVFVGTIALSGRDFGPMAAAEAEAQARPPEPAPDPADLPDPAHAWIAAIPVAVLVALTLTLLVADGANAIGPEWTSKRLFEILGEAKHAYTDMFAGAAVALVLGVLLTLRAGTVPASKLHKAAWSGMHPVFEALVVLYLAWMLTAAIDDTGAKFWLADLLGPIIPAWSLPTAVFVLAAGTAFATGTSFGTMGILIPLVVPLALTMGAGAPHILLGSTAAVLAGACLGDHASPISDTTVLSALGSGVDVVTHVRTQLPYALATGAVAIVFGTLPTGLGAPPLLMLPLGAAACIAIVMGVGRPVEGEAIVLSGRLG